MQLCAAMQNFAPVGVLAVHGPMLLIFQSGKHSQGASGAVHMEDEPKLVVMRRYHGSKL